MEDGGWRTEGGRALVESFMRFGSGGGFVGQHYTPRMASYKDLRAWHMADDLALAVHQWCDEHWTPQRAAVIEQARRAALSVSLNIAEGYACGPGPRCRYHLRIAHGSAVETAALLDFLHRLRHEVGPLQAQAASSCALSFRLWQRSRRS